MTRSIAYVVAAFALTSFAQAHAEPVGKRATMAAPAVPTAPGAPVAPGAGAPAAAPVPAPAAPAPIKLVARYDLSMTVDTTRNAKVATAANALKGALSLVGGSVPAGSIEDVVEISGERYTIRSKGKANRLLAPALGGDALSRVSEGANEGGGYIATKKFSETRGTRKRLLVDIDYAQRSATYHVNGKLSKKEEVPFRLADSASLPYLFLRQPAPSGQLTIAATDGLATRTIMLESSNETIDVAKQKVAAVHLTRIQKNGDDAAVDIWLRRDDGMPLKLRLGLDTQYGIVLEQTLAQLPPVIR